MSDDKKVDITDYQGITSYHRGMSSIEISKEEIEASLKDENVLIKQLEDKIKRDAESWDRGLTELFEDMKSEASVTRWDAFKGWVRGLLWTTIRKL